MEISKPAYPESFILVVRNGEIESQENFMILEEVQKYMYRKLGVNLGEKFIVLDYLRLYYKIFKIL